MKFSEKWLREWINPKANIQEIGNQLTMLGLELEGIEPAACFSGVVIAKVTSCKQHPNADRLSLCMVTDGKEEFQIVCGGKNVREGLVVALAKIGATIGDFKIKKSKIRDVVSFGMLCSETELGLAEESDGIIELLDHAPLGQSVAEYFELDDNIVELSVTPNRGDCNSLLGVAREVAVATKQSLNLPASHNVAQTHQQTLNINIIAPDACGRYLGRIIHNIDASIASPMWLQEKLRRSGINSISTVVDITNYVMLELGQPMHAFDLDKLSGSIDVRYAKEGEKLLLLNDEEVTLTPDVLVIADDSGAIAIAGVMGGKETSVTEQTKNILFESAFFHPEVVAKCVRQYKIHSESAYRFERGVDFQLQQHAIQRATQLTVELLGGKVGPIQEAEGQLPEIITITLRKTKLSAYLGFDIPEANVTQILDVLKLTPEMSGEAWKVTAPSYRFDLAIEEDIIEEVIRVYGFDSVPTLMPSFQVNAQSNLTQTIKVNPYRRLLADLGYREVITYSFVNDAEQQQLTLSSNPVRLENPISSDMNVMRTSLIPGLINTLKHNQHRQQDRVNIFEFGLCFKEQDNDIIQHTHLAGLISGNDYPQQWNHKPRAIDFFDIKADVEALLHQAGVTKIATFRPTTHPALHPGQCAEIVINGVIVGHIGTVHPEISNIFDLKSPIALFEIDLTNLPLTKKRTAYQAISKFPVIQRDLAIVIDKKHSSHEILASLKKSADNCVKNIHIFDAYEGKGMPEGKRSLGFSIQIQHPDKTLVDEEVANIIKRMVNSLGETYHFELRE